MTEHPGLSGAAVPSFAQERRIRSVRESGHAAPAAKTVPALCRLPDHVDVGALAQAVRDFAQRHRLLQYRFAERGDRVTLHWAGARAADIGCAVTDPAGRVEGGAAPAPASGDAAVRFARGEVDRAFDVLGWPLLRAGIVLDETPLFYIAADHLVSDGWSALLAMREIGELYASLLDGRETGLPVPGDFFRNSRVERRRYADGAALDQEVESLQKQLCGRPLHPPFPIDAGWDLTCGRYASLSLLDADETGRLEVLCKAWRVTVFMAVLAAFGVASRELSGLSTVGILVAFHNREEPGARDAMGWYSNMLPLYFATGAAERFADAVREVRARLVGLMPYHELPLARILDCTPQGYHDGIGTEIPTCFMSFGDVRAKMRETRWEPLDFPPSYRAGHGFWVSLRETGLSAEVASPGLRSGADQVRAFESRIAEVLRDVVAH
jgi:mycolipenoyl-CoA---2-(long-chain-fatty acyl)-trehalose mycolipenoyltransferase / long-chain-acyl-CoA---trehalose acyltransferase